MRPFVWVRYHSIGAWLPGEPASALCGPLLENATSAPAFDIDVSDLTIDDETRYRFARVDTLEPGEARPLESFVQPGAAPLTTAISRHIVERVLAGRQPETRWPVRIAYRSRRGRAYQTCCEIRVVGLPLGVSSIIVACGDGEPSVASGPASARSRSPGDI